MHRWDSTLETGHERIDRQHRQLFTAYDDLVDAICREKGRDEIFKTVDFLSGYVLMHFQMEEELQRESGYVDYPRHKRIHDEFRETVQDLVKRFCEEGPSEEFVAAVTGVIGDWLFNHVKGDDFRMAAFLISKGSA